MRAIDVCPFTPSRHVPIACSVTRGCGAFASRSPSILFEGCLRRCGEATSTTIRVHGAFSRRPTRFRCACCEPSCVSSRALRGACAAADAQCRRPLPRARRERPLGRPRIGERLMEGRDHSYRAHRENVRGVRDPGRLSSIDPSSSRRLSATAPSHDLSIASRGCGDLSAWPPRSATTSCRRTLSRTTEPLATRTHRASFWDERGRASRGKTPSIDCCHNDASMVTHRARGGSSQAPHAHDARDLSIARAARIRAMRKSASMHIRAFPRDCCSPLSIATSEPLPRSRLRAAGRRPSRLRATPIATALRRMRSCVGREGTETVESPQSKAIEPRLDTLPSASTSPGSVVTSLGGRARTTPRPRTAATRDLREEGARRVAGRGTFRRRRVRRSGGDRSPDVARIDRTRARHVNVAVKVAGPSP